MIQKSLTFPLLACVVAVGATAGVCVAAQTNMPVRPNLSGTWQLNRNLSEDAQEKMQRMGGGSEHGGGGHHAGGGGHGSEVQKLILNAPTRFVLTEDDKKVVLTEPDRHAQMLPTNNATVKVDGRDVRTRWESNRLISEIAVGDAKVTETYERSPSATQLIVNVTIFAGGQQLSVRRVYDAVTQ